MTVYSKHRKEETMLSLNNYLGDKEFDKFLIKSEITLTVWEIKFYLLGIVIGLEYVPPSLALSELLLEDTGFDIQFQNENQYTHFLEQFMSLWNVIACFDGIPSLCSVPDKVNGEELFHALTIREAEIGNFLSGLAESGSYDISEEFSAFHDEIDALESIDEEMSRLLESYESTNEMDGLKAKDLLQIAEEIFIDAFPVIKETILSNRVVS